MKILGEAISFALKNDDSLLSDAKEKVAMLCKKYPLYEGSLHTAGYIEIK